MTDKKVRALIVEDDMRISELHQRFVEKLPDFEVIGIANSIADATDMVELLQPDLILLDLFFPEGTAWICSNRSAAAINPAMSF